MFVSPRPWTASFARPSLAQVVALRRLLVRAVELCHQVHVIVRSGTLHLAKSTTPAESRLLSPARYTIRVQRFCLGAFLFARFAISSSDQERRAQVAATPETLQSVRVNEGLGTLLRQWNAAGHHSERRQAGESGRERPRWSAAASRSGHSRDLEDATREVGIAGIGRPLLPLLPLVQAQETKGSVLHFASESGVPPCLTRLIRAVSRSHSARCARNIQKRTSTRPISSASSGARSSIAEGSTAPRVFSSSARILRNTRRSCGASLSEKQAAGFRAFFGSSASRRATWWSILFSTASTAASRPRRRRMHA